MCVALILAICAQGHQRVGAVLCHGAHVGKVVGIAELRSAGSLLHQRSAGVVEQAGVAIRLLVHHVHGRHHAGAALLVGDNEGLAQSLAHILEQSAAVSVGVAAGLVRQDDGDGGGGPVHIAGGCGCRTCGAACGRGTAASGQNSCSGHHAGCGQETTARDLLFHDLFLL